MWTARTARTALAAGASGKRCSSAFRRCLGRHSPRTQCGAAASKTLGSPAARLPTPERSSAAGAMRGCSAPCDSFRRSGRRAIVSSRPECSDARCRALGRCRDAHGLQRGRELTCGHGQHIGAAWCFLEPQRRPPCELRMCPAAALLCIRSQHADRGYHAQFWHCTRAS